MALDGGEDLNRLTERIIGACMEVHKHLGPGLFESTYSECFADELGRQEIPFAREVPVTLRYKGRELSQTYRLDFVIDSAVIVELKALVAIEPVHRAQVLTYLRLSGLRAALLVNFHAPTLLAGLRRFLNDRQPR